MDEKEAVGGDRFERGQAEKEKGKGTEDGDLREREDVEEMGSAELEK